MSRWVLFQKSRSQHRSTLVHWFRRPVILPSTSFRARWRSFPEISLTCTGRNWEGKKTVDFPPLSLASDSLVELLLVGDSYRLVVLPSSDTDTIATFWRKMSSVLPQMWRKMSLKKSETIKPTKQYTSAWIRIDYRFPRESFQTQQTKGLLKVKCQQEDFLCKDKYRFEVE